jgi:hypothetical protein
LHEILQENEILESSIDPHEWKKECERVKDQLNYKFNSQISPSKTGTGNGTLFETEAEEINARRLQILDHIKVV